MLVNPTAYKNPVRIYLCYLCYCNCYVFFSNSFHNHIENGLSSERNVCSVYSVYSTNKIMKIITVAFIFQFLLSCWPKVDIMK